MVLQTLANKTYRLAIEHPFIVVPVINYELMEVRTMELRMPTMLQGQVERCSTLYCGTAFRKIPNRLIPHADG